MASGKSMTSSSFLGNSRSANYSADKRSLTVSWDCYPGNVYYNYYVPGGSTLRTGYYAADGIYRSGSGTSWKASTRCCYEKNGSSTPSLKEGVKCIKIQYRKNWGSWVTYKENKYGLDWNSCQLSLKSTKNGDYYEVKCTYQVWTQGSPFRDVPFMWFGDKYGYYNSGANQFKQSSCTPPKRDWSGMRNYTYPSSCSSDQNSGWSIITTTWARPHETGHGTNWAYLHSQYYGNSAWSSTYHTEFYKKGMDNGSNMGWTGNVTGRNPQTCRKTLWWNFEKTYSDNYTVSGVKEKPDPLGNPTTTIQTYDNMSVVESDNRYNGIGGYVKVTYKQPQSRTGYFNLYGVSTDANGNRKQVKVASEIWANHNDEKWIYVDFGAHGFVRGKSIAYFAESVVWDGDWGTNRTSYTTGSSFNECTAKGKHYFNRQPSAPSNCRVVTTGDRTQKMKVQWDAVADPEGHAVTYWVYVQRANNGHNTNSQVLYCPNWTNVKYQHVFTTTGTSYTIDTSGYTEGETLQIYICPADIYKDNTWYATKFSGTVDKDINVTLSVKANLTNKDSNGLYSGEHGTLSYKYENKHGRNGRIRVYAYMGNQNCSTSTGAYLKRIYDTTDCTIAPGSTVTLDVDFEKIGATRGRYLKYFAVADDTAGIQSNKPAGGVSGDAGAWQHWAKGWHYYNMPPTAATPFVSENCIATNDMDQMEVIFFDEKLELGWNPATDLEGNDIQYKMYIQIPGEKGNKTEVCYTSLSDSGTSREYTKVINLGANVYRDANNPYVIDCSEWIKKDINIWIKTCDKYNAKKYLSSSVLKLHNPGVRPEVPEIDIDYVYTDDFYGDSKQNGEAGYVRVNYVHPMGRTGTVKLHAIVKRIDGQMKIFQDITSWKLSSGSWSAKTKLNFPTIFGDDWRSSEIRYYATALTDKGESSEKDEWKPDTSMWESWVPGHKFNEEPSGTQIAFNDPLSNLHYNAVFDWSAAKDPDDSLYPVTYTVVLSVQSLPRFEMTFFHGPNKDKDIIRTYTQMWDTTNTRVEIDLDGFEEGESFSIWVVPHDDYTNSYYYTSNAISFKKATFGKPIVTTTLSQTDSEVGILKVKYEHEDVELRNGNYFSKDPDRKVEEFIGSLDIHCYVEDKYYANYIVEDQEIKIGQELTFEMPFEEIYPYSRSVDIRYLVIAEDTESLTRNTKVHPSKAEPNDLEMGTHYYNDEPENPEIIVGSLKDFVDENKYEEDKFIYGFNYIFLCWDQPYEPDADRCVYYVYLNTPDVFLDKDGNEIPSDEEVKTTTVNRKDELGNIEPQMIDYTRKYKIVEKYDKNDKLYGCDVCYIDGKTETLIQKDNPFIGLQIDFVKDHLGKQWPKLRKRDAEAPESAKYKYQMYVEAKDVRPLTNSYYGLSDMFESFRQEHEPPNDVQLQVIPNLSDGIGDGERGKIKVLYSHPEGDIPGKVDIYAFQDDGNGNFILKDKIYSINYIQNEVEQTIEIDFLENENSKYNAEEYRMLDRSKRITYYAIATDSLVGMTSYDKYNEIGLQMKYIPYLLPDENGLYNHYLLYINGVAYDYNDKDGHYNGPVLSGEHYFNEEPPETTPVEANEELISYLYAEIKWPHVKDPDGDKVQYELYVSSSDEYMNTNEKEFFNDSLDEKSEDDTEYQLRDEIMDIEPIYFSEVMPANGMMRYHKKVDIPASLAEESSLGLSVATAEYNEDSIIHMWLVSKDSYTNSYYRAGDVLTMIKGHKARDIRSVYPRNDSTVYATQPRILINLAEDNQRQTVYVQWKDQTYNNKEHPEHFSSYPGTKEAIIFKPPVPFTTLHGMKVTYSVWVHNQCSYSNKTYVTYTYKDFFNEFTEEKLIALKSDHINAFRKAINITRDAYGLETVKFTREIRKNMIFENFDFNETKAAICAINDLLNLADDTENLDYNNDLIVDLKDLDLVDYEGDILTGSYNEFLEWARLVYILENL